MFTHFKAAMTGTIFGWFFHFWSLSSNKSRSLLDLIQAPSKVNFYIQCMLTEGFEPRAAGLTERANPYHIS